MLPDWTSSAGKEIHTKEASEQVVELFRAPAIKPTGIKDFNCIDHLKKWLAVPAQYKFACKFYALAHIEKKAIEVTLHGQAWKVYPMKCRNKTISLCCRTLSWRSPSNDNTTI